MLKKVCVILIVVIIVTTVSLSAFAGYPDDIGSTTLPAISTGTGIDASSTGSAVNSTGSGIEKNTSGTGITADKSSSSTDSAIGKSSSSTQGAIATRKFEDFNKDFIRALKDSNARDDSYLIMEITSPDKDKDSTYMKSYVLSGNSKYSDVVVSIAKYNEGTGEYEPMYNTNGESSWEIGDFRLFSKEILLTKGTNKIKILAYRKSEIENAAVDNIQVNCFTIELLKESIIDKIINKAKDFSSIFGLDGSNVERNEELFK